MSHNEDPVNKQYPHGRGYGHDYMRGGEVLGGYGYADREEYELPRGALNQEGEDGIEATDDEAGEDGPSP